MDIVAVVGLIGAMSLSVERIVEIIKNMVPSLANKYEDIHKENRRKAFIHIMAALVGTVIALFAEEQIQASLPGIFKDPGEVSLSGCVIIGLLSSGSSSFWNQALTIVEEVKKSKKYQAKSQGAAN